MMFENREFHNFYSSPNVIKVIKPRRMKWAGHVARISELRSAYSILVGKPEVKYHLKDLSICERIVLN
jgi:hypothetical protein